MNFKDQSLAFRLFLDLLVIFFAFMFTSIMTHNFGIYIRKRDVLHIALLFYAWYHFGENYDYYRDFRLKNLTNDLFISFRSSTLLSLVYVVVAFLVDTGGDERVGFVLFSSVSFPLLFFRRYVFRKLVRFFSPNNKVPILFIGVSSVSKEIWNSIDSRPWMGYSASGVVNAEPDYELSQVIGEMERQIADKDIQRVFIQESIIRRTDLDELVSACLAHTVQTFLVPDGLKFYSERYHVQFFDGIPIIAVRKNPLDRFRFRTVKRIFDVAFSGVLLISVLPILFMVIGLVIKLSSKGPVFFVQKRWGLNNTPFNAYKFRSMVVHSQDVVEGKYQQAQASDPRITRVGAFLRKTNLDELPQFINVMLGDMSVVGPRPHPEPLNEESKGVVDFYLQRHLVKPGITGWAQVNGARGETKKVSQMQKRVDYDIWYIENWSFLLDVRIIMQTAWNMYKGEEHAY